MSSQPKSGSAEIANLLTKMNEEGGFPVSVLTNRQGFSIASAVAPDQDPEKHSAVVALVQKTASQVREQLEMAKTDEISVFDTNGQRLVCRPFDTNGHNLILAVIIPDRHTCYRRLTNKTVNAIRRLWKL